MRARSLMNTVKAVGAAFLTAAVLLLVLNVISLKNDDPDKFVGLFAYLTLFASAYAGGFVCARLNRSRGLASGISAGVMYAVCICIVSFIIRGEENFRFIFMLLMLLALVVVSAVGGVMGLPKEKSLKKRRKMLARRA